MYTVTFDTNFYHMCNVRGGYFQVQPMQQGVNLLQIFFIMTVAMLLCTRGVFKNICTWMCLPTSKFWFSLYLFLSPSPPIIIIISYKNGLISHKLGAFYGNLLKIHSIYVNGAPSSVMKIPPIANQNLQKKKKPLKGRHIYVYHVNVRPPSFVHTNNGPKYLFKNGICKSITVMEEHSTVNKRLSRFNNASELISTKAGAYEISFILWK